MPCSSKTRRTSKSPSFQTARVSCVKECVHSHAYTATTPIFFVYRVEVTELAIASVSPASCLATGPTCLPPLPLPVNCQCLWRRHNCPRGLLLNHACDVTRRSCSQNVEVKQAARKKRNKSGKASKASAQERRRTVTRSPRVLLLGRGFNVKALPRAIFRLGLFLVTFLN